MLAGEDENPRPLPRDLCEDRIRTGEGRATVRHFDDDVDRLHVLGDAPHRARHVTGVPLDRRFVGERAWH
jgi:hypothetical protein